MDIIMGLDDGGDVAVVATIADADEWEAAAPGSDYEAGIEIEVMLALRGAQRSAA